MLDVTQGSAGATHLQRKGLDCWCMDLDREARILDNNDLLVVPVLHMVWLLKAILPRLFLVVLMWTVSVHQSDAGRVFLWPSQKKPKPDI